MIQIIGITKMPLVKSHDDIGDQLVRAARDQSIQILDHDIIVVAQKIVSKSEGRVVDLQTVTPSTLANTIAGNCEKDPKHVEVILREAANIIRMRGPHIIVETRHGFVCANAGVDRSNAGDGDLAILLPIDPDRAAQKLRKRIRELTGADVGVIISDTFGRAWRNGQVNVAIGIDGLNPIMDYRGTRDMFGNQLKVTQIAIADELASAAELVMRKSDGIPVAIIRGVDYANGSGSIQQLIRPKEEDLFR
ncbi:MAG TPA: coenzyme F420-0:L-glutamate ligase [Candidatus Bathyarchaeia archaeon]|nr:coenzyme F420-0:L-glutamate ligase [Candidatus Bathyarchaeia archaeon]